MFALDHYSFSSLSSFNECPYAFYLEKIEKVPSLSNAFAEHGTFVHELMDGWAKKHILASELPEDYELMYQDKVVTKFPAFLLKKDYANKAFNKGLNYLSSFDEFNGFEVVSSEESFEIDINNHKFVGVIDLTLKDADGKYTICDHKSKSMASFKKARHHMFRQLYLYSKYFKEKHGFFPDNLMFNLFQENERITIPFDEQEYEDAVQWASDTIDRIENADLEDFLVTKKPDIFCGSICSVRNHCNNKS